MNLEEYVRDIPDFPTVGVGFKDVTPLLGNAAAFAESIAALVAPFRDSQVTKICAMEARGFIFGAAAASVLGCGFVPLRKPGKLPARTIGVDYALEYRVDRLEMHADALLPGDRVLIVDDVLATAGTLAAAAELVASAGVPVVGAAMLAEIAFLNGRQRWDGAIPLHCVMRF